MSQDPGFMRSIFTSELATACTADPSESSATSYIMQFTLLEIKQMKPKSAMKLESKIYDSTSLVSTGNHNINIVLPERSTDSLSTKSFYELEKQADQFCCMKFIEEKQTKLFHISYYSWQMLETSTTLFAIHFVVRKELCNQLLHLGN